MQPQVELLGHCINKEGIRAVERKIQSIRDGQPPKSRKELRSFLGIASYYRRLIKNFAKIARPLSEKTLEKVKFELTLPMQKLLDTLKQALTTAPVLVYLDFKKPFLVSTDSSSAAVGAVLSQLGENGRENPIHYLLIFRVQVKFRFS